MQIAAQSLRLITRTGCSWRSGASWVFHSQIYLRWRLVGRHRDRCGSDVALLRSITEVLGNLFHGKRPTGGLGCRRPAAGEKSEPRMGSMAALSSVAHQTVATESGRAGHGTSSGWIPGALGTWGQQSGLNWTWSGAGECQGSRAASHPSVMTSCCGASRAPA